MAFSKVVLPYRSGLELLHASPAESIAPVITAVEHKILFTMKFFLSLQYSKCIYQ